MLNFSGTLLSMRQMLPLTLLCLFLRHNLSTCTHLQQRNSSKAKKRKKMCGSGYPTFPKFLPPTLIFFSKFWSWKRITEQNNFVLLFSTNFRIWRKNTYQNDDLKWKSKFLCIQSLVLDVKGLKQSSTFYISFVLFNTFPSRSEYSKTKSSQKKKSILPTYPIFFSGCNLNHTYFFCLVLVGCSW